MRIRSKILSGCLGLTMLTGLLGMFEQRAERRLGDVAPDIYDRAFMAVSYLREAQLGFERLAADAAGGRPGPASRVAAQEVLDDLDIVRERAMSESGRGQAASLRRAVAAARAGFERLVETFADDGFGYRRGVGLMVALEKRETWAALSGSLLAALAITALVSRLIAPPVRRAVRPARQIAAGRLDNAIDSGGHDETGDLLRALSVMQASIASGMARIRALMDEQAASHAGEIAAGHAQMQAALSNMSQGLCLFGEDGRLRVANRRFIEMFGAAWPGQDSDQVLRAAGRGAVLDLSRGLVPETFACELADGRSIAVSQAPIEGGGWVATYEDISERRAAERRLAHAARHDLLTGLPNRLLFAEHMRDGVGLDAAERPREATMLAQRVIEALSAPFEIEQQQVAVGASVGIALSREGLDSPEALLKCADLALYRAKREGRGSFRFFEAEMDTRMQARRVLEQDLRRAVAEQQFELFYQPLVESGAGISGFEALLRWRHPERGLVGPDKFIPLAEEVGLIPALGRWVLRRACADAASWPSNLKVAVNLSPSQFRAGLAEEVTDALAAAGLSARRLELEITESVLLRDDEKVLATLHAIRALGARIAMDDFGTGYSSLGYLRRFPFDKIKIDQSFVRGMTDEADCMAIVRAVIGLGRSLGIAINAEGVETTAQHQALISEGCGELQGYLFSRPRPAAAVAEMLREFGTAPAHDLAGAPVAGAAA